MKTIKVSEATGPALDWLVAKCEWVQWTFETATVDEIIRDCHYSTDWAQGGPIKERERISTDWDSGTWNASSDKTPCYFSAPSELVAAMRAHVYSKLGDTAEVPEELV